MACFGLCSFLLFLVVVYKVVDWFLRLPKLGLSTKTKNILVTGCDTGFGHLFAKRMDMKGFCVFAGCLTDEGIKTLTETCSSQMKAFKLNVANEESVESAVVFVKSNLGDQEALWAIINNAGIGGQLGQTSWMNRRDYDIALNVNFHGVRHMCEVFLPLLKQSRGRIVNVASMLGRISPASTAPYAVSKFAVEAFSDALRRDIYAFDISVHIIEPGFFKTDILEPTRAFENVKRKWNSLPEEIRQQYGEDFPKLVQDQNKKTVDALASTKLHLVVDAYEHATLAVRPRARYPVGGDTWLLVPLSLLPAWVGDKFFQRSAVKPKAGVV